MADGFSAYGWGQSLSDMLGGYLSETDKIRQENEKKNQEQLEIEKTALQHLMTSDDPRVKAAAMTSWLTPRTSGPGPLAKWYNQQENHPVFEQVQTILGQGTPGMRPWLTPEEKTESEYEGSIRGKTKGIFGAYKQYTGQEPPQGFVEHTLQGMAGGAQSVKPLQRVNMILQDGSTIPGSYDPNTGYYYDNDMNYRSDVVRSAPSANLQSYSAGDYIWKQRTDGRYDVFHKSDSTKVLSTTDQPYLMPPGPAPGLIPPGPSGEPAQTVVGGRRPGEAAVATPVPGTGRAPESLRQTYDRLNALKREIEAQAQRDDPNILGRDRSVWEPALEFYAQKNGIPSYRALIDRLNELDRQLQRQPQGQPQGGITPPPGPITPTAARGAGVTKPRETPATGPASRPAATAQPALSNTDVQKVLDLLHIETGQTPQRQPQRPQP